MVICIYEIKKLIVGHIVGAGINEVFRVLYTATGNLIPSILVTGVVSIVVIETLRRMAKRN